MTVIIHQISDLNLSFFPQHSCYSMIHLIKDFRGVTDLVTTQNLNYEHEMNYMTYWLDNKNYMVTYSLGGNQLPSIRIFVAVVPFPRQTICFQVTSFIISAYAEHTRISLGI